MPEETGKKDQWVAIMAQTETADTEGNPVKNWTVLRNVWARAESLFVRQGEFQLAGAVVSETHRKFTVNYRTDYAEKMRVVWRGVNWNIYEVQPTEDMFDTALFASRIQ